MADQSNSGRNILIIGALLGAATAGFGIYTFTSVKVHTPDTQVSAGKSDDSLTKEAEAVKNDLKSDRTVKDTAPEGATINGEPRLAPFGFSTELWQATVTPADGGTPSNMAVDIYDPASQNIHGDVPNAWFITNGLADALGRSDGLEMDNDSDGFSNGEEFLAHTNPTDAASYPPLVQTGAEPKLAVKKVDVARAFIMFQPSFEENPTEAEVRVFAKETDPAPLFKKTVKVGEAFDLTKDGTTGRFTVTGFDKKHFDMDEIVLKVHDNVTASADKDFVIRAGKSSTPSKDRNTPNEKGHHVSDTTVIFTVTGGPKAKSEVSAQLNGSFVIPGGYSDGKTMNATVESIDKSGDVNIRVEGLESPVSVKGAPKNAHSSKK